MYLNRALCNFKLEKYDESLYDCMKAIKINEGISNFKAYYRAGLSLVKLLRFHDGEICIKRAKEVFQKVYPNEIPDEFDTQLHSVRRELLREFGMLLEKEHLADECDSIPSLVDSVIDSQVSA